MKVSVQGINTLLDALSGQPSLIVFAERPDMGLAAIMKESALALSAREKVLFITYRDYKERVFEEFATGHILVPDQLMINDNVNYLHSTLAEEIQQLVQQSECDTLILDNLDAMLGESYEMDYLRRNHFIQGLRDIVDELKIRIILCAPVSEKAELRRGAMIPRLEDITWARPLTALADQVIALYRPDYYDALEDDWGNSLVDLIYFYFLKNLEAPVREINPLILKKSASSV